MLRKLGRWLLKDELGRPPAPPLADPIVGGTLQDADHWMGPCKLEPGLNDFAFPQEQLDAEIPDCSQRAQRT